MGRRMEGYKNLHLEKFSLDSGHVQNCGISWINSNISGISIKEIGKREYFHTVRENSFHYAVPRL